MKMHARHNVTVKAQLEISEAVTNTIGKYDLTYPEIFAILGGLIQTWAKWAVKDEREA